MNVKKSSFFLLSILIILIFSVLLHFHRASRAASGRERTFLDRRPDRRNEVVRAIEKALPAVVNISTERVIEPGPNDPDDLGMLQQLFDKFLRSQRSSASYSLGSGCIIDPSGLIVTNAQVVERAARIRITLGGGLLIFSRAISLTGSSAMISAP